MRKDVAKLVAMPPHEAPLPHYHRDGAGIVMVEDEPVFVAECDTLEDAQLIAKVFAERNQFLAALKRVEGILGADPQRDHLVLQHMVQNARSHIAATLKEPAVSHDNEDEPPTSPGMR